MRFYIRLFFSQVCTSARYLLSDILVPDGSHNDENPKDVGKSNSKNYDEDCDDFDDIMDKDKEHWVRHAKLQNIYGNEC